MLGNTDSIHEILVIVQNSDDPLPLLWTQKLIKIISHILIHGHISAKIIWIFPFETQIGLVECATNKTFIKTSLANRLDELPKQTNSKSQPSFVGMAIICLTIWVCIWYSIISCSFYWQQLLTKTLYLGHEANDIRECLDKWEGSDCLMDCCNTDPAGICCSRSKATSK